MNDVVKSIYDKPVRRMFWLLICSIFAFDLLVSLFPAMLPPLSKWSAILLDSTLLLIMVFPLLYFFLLRPMNIHITEREKAEEEALKAKRDWEDSFDVINDIITIHDADYNILHANKAAESFLGLAMRDILTNKCFKSYHGSGCPPEGCPSCQTLNTGVPSSVELFEPHLNKFVEFKAMPRFDADHNIIGVVHHVRDITERKKMEADLLAREKEFRNLVEEAPLAITVVNKAGELEYINKKNVEIIGYTRNETPTLELWWSLAYSEPEERKKVTALWGDLQNRVLSGENIGVTERKITCKDGTTKDVELRFSRAGDKVLVIFNDITESKRAVKELQRYSSELEKSNKELQEALAEVKTLSGMLPICASCKKIRDDKGYWNHVETYVSKHTEAVFTSGICPECEKKMYEELEKLKNENS
jgi:PAS domain S-box-containing protein